jgi:hypothetical protein
MEIRWIISNEDLGNYADFVERFRHHSVVQKRISRNIKHDDVKISKASFWQTLIGCLVTTRQKAGEGSRVKNFMETDKNLLNINFCLKTPNLVGKSKKILSWYGLRRSETIAAQIGKNGNWLKEGGWIEVKRELENIASHTTKKKERETARFLQRRFDGLGPKQSRNLIQWMGLSKYEIPLDSRMVKVLHNLNFPAPLSAQALADEGYYCFIEDGIQLIMKKIGVYPCVFDACAFASLERL